MCLDHQNQFVHLHCHSEYSLLDGLSKIKDLVGRAAELKQPALALTDHGAMYGILPFYRACKDKGIKPILGIETYLATRRMSDRDPQLDKERAHMLLLAQNQTGYTNLLEMATLSQLEGYYYKPRIDHHVLAQFSAGVISTTGCLAAKIPQALMNGRMEEAHHLMGEYLDIFGKERFFIELQEHSIPELTDVNRKLIEMAPRYGLERNFLLTNDVHYTRADDADPHQVLLCIQTGSTIGNPKMTFSDKGYYLKSYEEMVQLFEGYDEQLVLNGLQNSVRIIDQCEVNLDSEGYHLPLYDVPAEHTPNSYLRFLCQRGLAWRYGANRAESDPALQQRLEHELNIIGRMGFETYFLIVWDLCEWAGRTDEWWERYQDPFPYSSYSEWKRNDIWWNVRGSGAGSVVAYTLGITSIDPLANGLIFERFLNPGRVSMPDIDLDYPDDVRHWMVAYTKRKYGTDKVAQIITYGTLGARAAIRDVGRALDIPLPEVDSIAKLIAAVPGKPVKIENCFDSTHEFYSKELVEKYNNDNRVKRLVDTAKKLEGVTRHASSHAAGVIVSDQPLQKYVPLNRPTSGEEGLGGVDRVTQWPMEIVESIGLLKIDFLGLSTLTVMRRAARLIEERHGVVYTMDNIPYDEGHVGPDPKKDPKKLFDMLGRGDVAGVFQVEGAGMRRLMIDMKPRRFDHIIAAISLYRPGPMDNIPEYIKRMHSDIYQGKDIVQYHTPALTPILQDTYGILVYQEQIIRIASDLAGYEPGEADMIRKAVSKKKRDLIDKHKVQFTAGAMARGLTQEVCDAIWGDIEFFARYGFNKSHAADYAKVTCQTAFLKAHYPVEYLTAMLSVERNNAEKVRFYFAEAKNLGLKVLPPDINRSQVDFTIEDEATYSGIRFGLGAIKNVGEAALNHIFEERAENGAYPSLQIFCERVDLRRVGKRPLEFMIKARVFERWGNPIQLLDALDRMVGESGRAHDVASSGQMGLFNMAASPKLSMNLINLGGDITPEQHKIILNDEKESLGVHVSEHPLERPLNQLKRFAKTTTGQIDSTWNGKEVRVAGVITYLRHLTTKKGDHMAFSAVEDLEGKIDLVLFPKMWQENKEKVKMDQIVVVWGKVQADEENTAILVDRVRTFEELTKDDNTPPPAEEEPTPSWYQAIPTAPTLPDEEEEELPPMNPQPKLIKTPAAPPVQPVISQPTAVSASVLPAGLPPEPEWADEEWDELYLEPPTAVLEKPMAKPVNGNSNGSKPHIQEVAERYETVAVPEVERPQGVKTVVVEFLPLGNWQELCRTVLQLMIRFKGPDHILFTLANQNIQIEFPGHTTLYCAELTSQLNRIQGIVKVAVQNT